MKINIADIYERVTKDAEGRLLVYSKPKSFIQAKEGESKDLRD